MVKFFCMVLCKINWLTKLTFDCNFQLDSTVLLSTVLQLNTYLEIVCLYKSLVQYCTVYSVLTYFSPTIWTPAIYHHMSPHHVNPNKSAPSPTSSQWTPIQTASQHLDYLTNLTFLPSGSSLPHRPCSIWTPISPREYWVIYREPRFLAVVWFGFSPASSTSHPSSQ